MTFHHPPVENVLWQSDTDSKVWRPFKEFGCSDTLTFFSLFRGNVDKFEFSSKNLGDIAGICLGHTPKDGKKVKGEVYWYVQEVTVTEKELGNK